MLIRDARPDDAIPLSLLSAELGYPVPDRVLTERIQNLPSDHAVLVADDDGLVIAWIDVGLSFHLQSGIKAEIGGLVVAASNRSQGIGSQLLRRAEDWAREHHADKVTLRSNIKRADAHRFYLREQYTQTKTSAVFEKTL
jgi:GNAT superfamily N-acetyltransferase